MSDIVEIIIGRDKYLLRVNGDQGLGKFNYSIINMTSNTRILINKK